MNATRRNLLLGCGAAACMALFPALDAKSAEASGEMPLFRALKTRRSVRAYTDEPVSEGDIDEMLKAAMDAPSAANEQPWEFVVIRNKDTLAGAGKINKYASFAARAPLAILVCLNERKEKEKGMGVLDVGMSAENLLLAAHGLGLGAVFTGIYPIEERIKGFQRLCGLPDYVIPLGLVVIGHPQIKGLREAEDRYNKAAIHQEKWTEANTK